MKSKSYDLGGAILHAGDCTEILPTLSPVDAIVTDPPYGLEFMGKEWNTFKTGRASKYKKLSKLDLAPILDGRGKGIIGPHGGNIPVEALPQGIQRPALRCARCGKQKWSGSPCKCDAPDFRADNSPLLAFEDWCGVWAAACFQALKPGGYLLAFGGTRTHHRLWCAIEDAGFVIQDTIMWIYGSGFPKGSTQLKPAHEPICVAYKPGGKRTLQVDDGRISSVEPPMMWETPRGGFWATDQNAKAALIANDKGRWPANVCHDGSDEVMEAFAAFGKSKSPPIGSMGGGSNKHAIYGDFAGVRHENGYGDNGTAARFFYCAKANKHDRAGSKHPTVKPIALMRWLVRLVTPPNGTVLDPFAGSGTTGAAAIAEGRNAILIEREPEYIGDIRRRLKVHKAAA